MFTDSHFVNKVEGMGVIVCTPRSLCFALSEGTVNPKDSYIMIDEAHINTLW
jgi:ERCC4-related helicase